MCHPVVNVEEQVNKLEILLKGTEEIMADEVCGFPCKRKKKITKTVSPDASKLARV